MSSPFSQFSHHSVVNHPPLAMKVYDVVRRAIFGCPGVYIPQFRHPLTPQEVNDASVLRAQIKERVSSEEVLQLRLNLIRQEPPSLSVSQVLQDTKRILESKDNERAYTFSSNLENPHVCIQPNEATVAKWLLGPSFYDKYIRNKKKKNRSEETNKLKLIIPYLNLIVDTHVIEVRKSSSAVYGEHNLAVFTTAVIPAQGYQLHQLSGQQVRISKAQYDDLREQKLDISVIEKPEGKDNSRIIYRVLAGPISLVNYRCYQHATAHQQPASVDSKVIETAAANVQPASSESSSSPGTAPAAAAVHDHNEEDSEEEEKKIDHKQQWYTCSTNAHQRKALLRKNTEITIFYGESCEDLYRCPQCPARNSRKKKRKRS